MKRFKENCGKIKAKLRNNFAKLCRVGKSKKIGKILEDFNNVFEEYTEKNWRICETNVMKRKRN